MATSLPIYSAISRKLLVSLSLVMLYNHDYTRMTSSFASSLFIGKNSHHLRCATSTSTGVSTGVSAGTTSSSLSSSSLPCGTNNNQIDIDSKNALITWPSSPSSSSSSSSYDTTQTKEEAQNEIIAYLYKNLMPFDLLSAESLGFPSSSSFNNNNNDTLPDGLSNGILQPTMNISLYAKQNYPWTNNVPKDLYYEYVINFANVNEARTNWRPIFHDLVQPIIQPLLLSLSESHEGENKPNDFISNSTTLTTKQVIQELNDKIWTHAASYSNKEVITFQHGQTPLIYDPMSILLFGYASCTGLSIFFVNILRTVGIPARLGGTAAWNGKEENGNHSWIEVWDSDDGKWHIMESKPASGDHGDRDLYDPCQWWFCNKDKVEDTMFWAARLDQEKSGSVIFPMAWDMDNLGVVGEDRTMFMRDLCSVC